MRLSAPSAAIFVSERMESQSGDQSTYLSSYKQFSKTIRRSLALQSDYTLQWGISRLLSLPGFDIELIRYLPKAGMSGDVSFDAAGCDVILAIEDM
ncbi:MAG: hypothetical protein U9N46_00480 [Euryarchaeota archaeon]|nr:hypothetical protein [Euryarchaeota archaeon]